MFPQTHRMLLASNLEADTVELDTLSSSSEDTAEPSTSSRCGRGPCWLPLAVLVAMGLVAFACTQVDAMSALVANDASRVKANVAEAVGLDDEHAEGDMAEGGEAEARAGEGEGEVVHSVEAHRDIICPFFGTLINERVLPVQKSYPMAQLLAFTVAAGVSESTAVEHTNQNFRNNPIGRQDLFDMEGAANEHFTSTGINDCKTFFWNCRRQNSNQLCKTNTPNKKCGTPNSRLFRDFWRIADRNRDGWLSSGELFTVTKGPNQFKGFIVDKNRSAWGVSAALSA